MDKGNLVENELFSHEKGAFTGARYQEALGCLGILFEPREVRRTAPGVRMVREGACPAPSLFLTYCPAGLFPLQRSNSLSIKGRAFSAGILVDGP
ncbi:MAG: sigma 54-interacting transcriptional regulator [Deltaproteobacteria bacterium]|nr:sigma 54-interacting transcriptional regulator [Deltaproteobacteria bacterium]